MGHTNDFIIYSLYSNGSVLTKQTQIAILWYRVFFLLNHGSFFVLNHVFLLWFQKLSSLVTAPGVEWSRWFSSKSWAPDVRTNGLIACEKEMLSIHIFCWCKWMQMDANGFFVTF